MKIGQIIAIAIGGTCTISSIIIWFFLLIAVGEGIEPIFEYATLIIWVVLEAITCWIVVKLSKNRNILIVTVGSCGLNIIIFLGMRMYGYLKEDFWVYFIFFYYPYLLLFALGTFVVHKIMTNEEHRRTNK